MWMIWRYLMGKQSADSSFSEFCSPLSCRSTRKTASYIANKCRKIAGDSAPLLRWLPQPLPVAAIYIIKFDTGHHIIDYHEVGKYSHPALPQAFFSLTIRQVSVYLSVSPWTTFSDHYTTSGDILASQTHRTTHSLLCIFTYDVCI